MGGGSWTNDLLTEYSRERPLWKVEEIGLGRREERGTHGVSTYREPQSGLTGILDCEWFQKSLLRGRGLGFYILYQAVIFHELFQKKLTSHLLWSSGLYNSQQQQEISQTDAGRGSSGLGVPACKEGLDRMSALTAVSLTYEDAQQKVLELRIWKPYLKIWSRFVLFCLKQQKTQQPAHFPFVFGCHKFCVNFLAVNILGKNFCYNYGPQFPGFPTVHVCLFSYYFKGLLLLSFFFYIVSHFKSFL